MLVLTAGLVMVVSVAREVPGLSLVVMNPCVMNRISSNLLFWFFTAIVLFAFWMFVQFLDSTRELYPREAIQYNVNSKLLSVEERMKNNTIVMVKVRKTFSKDESDEYRLLHKIFNKISDTEFAEFFNLERRAKDMEEIKEVQAWGDVYCRDGFFYVGYERLYGPNMEIIGGGKIGDGYPYDNYLKGFDGYAIEEDSDLDDIAKEVCPSSRY